MSRERLPEGSRRLIILGCGYLGAAIARTACKQRWAVEGLTRNAEQAERLRRAFDISVVVADIACDDWHREIDPRGAVAVVSVSSGGGGERAYRHAYLAGMESVLRWSREGSLASLIYTGSTSVYADNSGGWVDEDTPPVASTPLNEILLETENLLSAAVHRGTLPSAAVLRLAGIYGPGRHHLIDTLQKGVTEFSGSGSHHLNLIHRDDAAEAILRVAGRSEGGFHLFNVADGKPARKATIVEWTAEQLGLSRPTFHPERVSARMQRRALVDGRAPDRKISADKLSRAHRWEPAFTDFQAGYRAILAEDVR